MGHNPWLTDYLDYPAGVNLMWTPTPFAPALLVAPVVLAFGPVVAYNLLMTLSPALSAWSGSATIGQLVPSRAAALVGGLVYGFSPFVFAEELGHLGFVMAWLPPLVLLLLHELLVRRRWNPLATGALLGLVGGLQLYTSSELLATTVLVGLLGLLTMLVVARAGRLPIRSALATLTRGGSAAVVTGAVVGGPGVLTMLFGPGALHGVIQPPDTFVTDLASLVVPDHNMLIAPDGLARLTQSFTGNGSEWGGYIGLPMLILLAVTAVRWRDRPVVRWASILAAAVVVLSLGPHLHVLGRVLEQVPLPWWPLDHVPVFSHALPSRMMVYFYLFAGVLVAWFVQEAVLAGRGVLARLSALALVLLSLLALVPMAAPWLTPHPDAAFFSGPAVRRVPPGSVTLVVPWAAPQDAVAMSWQAESGYRYRMPEGYALWLGPGGEVAFAPPLSSTSTTLLKIEGGDGAPARSAELRRSMACDLVRWRVRTVVIGPMSHRDEAATTMSWVLDREPEPTAGALVWWDVAAHCVGPP